MRVVVWMDTLTRLKQLLEQRGWSEYRLAKESGLSQTTIGNIFRRNTDPTVSTLESICRGFGITLSQFFADGERIELTPELKRLIDSWLVLSPRQKEAAQQMIDAMIGK